MTNEDNTFTWQPTKEGARVYPPRSESRPWRHEYDLNRRDLKELRDDMIEAYALARGRERITCAVSDIQPGDEVSFGGREFTVSDLLTDIDDLWVVQFELDVDDDFGTGEFVVPGTMQVLVWRPIQ